ncbi:MAG TPA: hypothetical protein VG603_16905, partial [Chitinophagales bacterium]|nr:hypothetical protein [Chitinophagales bacterium]
METFKKGTVLLLGFLPALVFAQQNNTTNAPVPHSMPMSVSTAHDAAIKANSYDSDGDGIPDSTDACLLVKGLPQYQGCPYPKNITPTDQDGDGVADAFD